MTRGGGPYAPNELICGELGRFLASFLHGNIFSRRWRIFSLRWTSLNYEIHAPVMCELREGCRHCTGYYLDIG